MLIESYEKGESGPFEDRALTALVRNGKFGWNCYRGGINAEWLLIKEAAVVHAREIAVKFMARLEVSFAQLPNRFHRRTRTRMPLRA
jgi:hypothetical protein